MSSTGKVFPLKLLESDDFSFKTKGHSIRSSLSKTSKKSVKTSKSQPSLIDFKKIHDRSSRLIMAGRNPIAIPRQSELWHYWFETTNTYNTHIYVILKYNNP